MLPIKYSLIIFRSQEEVNLFLPHNQKSTRLINPYHSYMIHFSATVPQQPRAMVSMRLFLSLF